MSELEEYWEKRYRSGGRSGAGSIGNYRKWRWHIIDGYICIQDKNLLDVGCGDLSFMKKNLRKINNYTGIDVSSFIIEKNKKKYPHHSFIFGDASIIALDDVFDVVFCFDMLFHIIADDTFTRLLSRLNEWAGDWLFLTAWSVNTFVGKMGDGVYQRFRDPNEWIDTFAGLELVGKHQNEDGINTLYVLRRLRTR